MLRKCFFYFFDVCHVSSQKPVVLQTILPCLNFRSGIWICSINAILRLCRMYVLRRISGGDRGPSIQKLFQVRSCFIFFLNAIVGRRKLNFEPSAIVDSLLTKGMGRQNVIAFLRKPQCSLSKSKPLSQSLLSH